MVAPLSESENWVSVETRWAVDRKSGEGDILIVVNSYATPVFDYSS